MNDVAEAKLPADPKPAAKPIVGQSPVMAMIAAAARDPEFDPGKLEKLVGMAEREQARRAETAFNVAMAAAQQEMRRVATDKTNSHTKTSYASYAQLDRAIRPLYTKHGLALSFDTGDNPPAEHVRVICHVMHKDGHSRDYRADIPCDGKGAQGKDVMTKTHAVGSAMSYGSRYLLKLIFNVAVGEDDDDGNAAGGGSEPISEDMLAELNGMLEQCNGDPEKFCKYMKVEAMADIPQKDMGKAREALNNAINEYQRNRSKNEAAQ